jgi:hypothetical protein
MKATLIIGSEHLPERRFQLRPRPARKGGVPAGFTVHPASVIKRLNGDAFKDLRDCLGARIETDDVRSAAEILRLGGDRLGLVPVR